MGQPSIIEDIKGKYCLKTTSKNISRYANSRDSCLGLSGKCQIDLTNCALFFVNFHRAWDLDSLLVQSDLCNEGMPDYARAYDSGDGK